MQASFVIHLGESHSEAEWSETRTTALADLWKSEHSSSFTAMRSRGGGFSSTQFVDQLGVLGPDCHVAHGVYMRADDRRRLRARQTAVALCPRSNRVIGLGAPRGSRHSASVIIFLLGRDEEARWHLAAHLRPRRLRVGLISARPKH